MLELIQNNTKLIGCENDCQALATKDRADLLVISDTHGGIQNLCTIIKNAGPSCQALLFCGDGISDLFTLMHRTKSDMELFAAFPPVVACVKGNNDGDLILLNESIVRIPKDLVFSAAGHRIFMTHGHDYRLYSGFVFLYDAAKAFKADLTFYGHTHLAAVTKKRKDLILNPGSASLPRGGQAPSFAIVHVDSKKRKSTYTFYRVGEDVVELYDGARILKG